MAASNPPLTQHASELPTDLTTEEEHDLQQWTKLLEPLRDPGKVEAQPSDAALKGTTFSTLRLRSKEGFSNAERINIPENSLFLEYYDTLRTAKAERWPKDISGQTYVLDRNEGPMFTRVNALQRVALHQIQAITEHLENVDVSHPSVIRIKLHDALLILPAAYINGFHVFEKFVASVHRAIQVFSNYSTPGLRISYSVLRDMLLSWSVDIMMWLEGVDLLRTSGIYKKHEFKLFTCLLREITMRLWLKDPEMFYAEPLDRLHGKIKELMSRRDKDKHESERTATMFQDIKISQRITTVTLLLADKVPLEIAQTITLHAINEPRVQQKGLEYLYLSDKPYKPKGHCEGCSDGLFVNDGKKTIDMSNYVQTSFPTQYTSQQLSCPHFQVVSNNYDPKTRGPAHMHYRWHTYFPFSCFREALCRVPLDECKGHYNSPGEWGTFSEFWYKFLEQSKG